MKKTYTIYCGSSGHGPETHKKLAISLGKKTALNNIDICYGGMNAGLMYLTAESCLRSGGTVIGVIPKKLKDSERIHTGLTKMIMVDDLWQRKQKMYHLGDAFIALPGGYGTLDEALEILYWGAMGLSNKPLLFLNAGNYWSNIINMLKNKTQNIPHAKFNFCDFMLTADNVDEAFEKLDKWQIPDGTKHQNIPDLPHFEEEIINSNDTPLIILENSIDNIYKLSTALTLKQLGAHKRPIGILNSKNQYQDFIDWAKTAQKQTYITKDCLKLFTHAQNISKLQEKVKDNKYISIDLQNEKWGEKPKFND